MKRIVRSAILGLVISMTLGMGQVAFAQSAAPDVQTSHNFEEKITKTLKTSYLLYLPKDYGNDPAKKWPLMVFLHGSGESGNDLNIVKKHGPPKLIAAGRDFPFIVVSPQAPSEQEGWNVEALNHLLDDVIAHHNVDQDRVYLTGLSMGGFGAWAWATANPERFAAVAPICGGGVAHYAGRAMKNLPVWAFYGAKDNVVDPRETIDMVNALKKNGAQDVTLTVYPDTGHNSWTEAYNTDALYTWMLAHTRAAKAP